VNILKFYFFNSENTPEGRKTTKLDKILLNGNNITMVNTVIYFVIPIFFLSYLGSKFFLLLLKLIPGGEGPES
jgi:hypothetical protein